MHGFVNVKGITGESKEKNHKEWIEILAYNHAMSQATTIGGGTGDPFNGGGVQLEPFTFEKHIDSTSPLLAQYCCEGKPIDEIVVDLCTAAGEAHVYMQYTLKDAVIASVQSGGVLAQATQRPLETVALAFGEIEWAYTPLDSRGRPGAAVRGRWVCPDNTA